MILKTIIELTGCNWKQATTAIQKIREDSAPASRNHDELISAICEQVMRDNPESARIMRDREAERQRQLENQAIEESILTVTYKYWSQVNRSREGITTNFEKSVMPDNLRANGVPIQIWEMIFMESVNVFRPKFGYCCEDCYIGTLNYITLYSNFNAKANFLLNPYGILVQIGTTFEPVELKIVNRGGVIDEGPTKSVRCFKFVVKFEPILSYVVPAAVALETL